MTNSQLISLPRETETIYQNK